MTRIVVIVGAMTWLAAWIALSLPLEAAILLFAPLVLVPLGLDLIVPKSVSDRVTWTSAWLQLPAAILLAASFLPVQGPLAALLATPWLIVTLLFAARGTELLRRHGLRLDYKAAAIAALLFIPVGGAWAVISRAGLRPQGFSPAIVLLTAVHFHYAGFALPLIAAATLRSRATLSSLDRSMLLCIIGGVPAVGLGISLSPHVEVVAAIVLSLGCLILAARQIQAAWATHNPTRVSLALISSLSVVSAMVLAAIYAVGEFTGHRWLDIPTMIRTHGALNAFGFAACGIAAWSMDFANRRTNWESHFSTFSSSKSSG
jgi:YndJ-like protein